jgi:hypothetical protein
MKLKIAGYPYNVEYQEGLIEKEEACGMSSGDKLEIVIDPRLSPEMKMSTLIHEVIESLNYHYELGLKHNVIATLEAGLFQVVNDNPEVFTINMDGMNK